MALAGALPSPALFKNFGADATKNVRASAGVALGFSCRNTNAAIRFFQLHDTATVPDASAVPAIEFPVGIGALLVVGTEFFTAMGLLFDNGIAFAFSTTSGTYTAGSAADQTTQVVHAKQAS